MILSIKALAEGFAWLNDPFSCCIEPVQGLFIILKSAFSERLLPHSPLDPVFYNVVLKVCRLIIIDARKSGLHHCHYLRRIVIIQHNVEQA